MSETKATFPDVGQYFGVVFADGSDKSYREDVWRCIASDEHRIVASAIDHCGYKTNVVFYRKDWMIQAVSNDVVAAVQIKAEERGRPRTA